MILSISTDRIDTTTRLNVTGEIDMESVPVLSHAIGSALDAATGTVLVDLGGAVFCDCAGVTALLDGRRHAVDRQIGYQVVNPHGNPLRVLRILGLHAVLTTSTAASGCGRTEPA
jgi:anti-sigma B factor antagonist